MTDTLKYPVCRVIGHFPVHHPLVHDLVPHADDRERPKTSPGTSFTLVSGTRGTREHVRTCGHVWGVSNGGRRWVQARAAPCGHRAASRTGWARGGRATWTGSGRGAFGCPGPALRSAGGGQSHPIPHHGSALVNLPSLGLLCDMALDLRKWLLIPRCLSVF